VLDSSLPMLSVPRVAHRIRIDGELHKAPWTELAPAALAPSQGGAAPPDFRATALRTCHDGARLYVAFDCVAASIVATHAGRNAPLYEEDVVEAFFAPAGDPRVYFELETSPKDAWFEARVASPDRRRDTMVVDRDWICAGFEHATRRDARGWRAEWAIPFASLDAPPPRPGDRWRANFYRIDQANGGAYSAWSPTFADPPDFHVPDRFGVLVF
jgi:hypothetical protein